MEEKRKRGRPKSDRPTKEQWAMKLAPEFLAYLQAAAYWVPGMTVTKIFEEGAALRLKQLEAEFNKGKRFGPIPPKPAKPAGE